MAVDAMNWHGLLRWLWNRPHEVALQERRRRQVEARERRTAAARVRTAELYAELDRRGLDGYREHNGEHHHGW